jgi:hypothetical protein
VEQEGEFLFRQHGTVQSAMEIEVCVLLRQDARWLQNW